MTVMATSDYKNYSVDKVREWVQDALQTEATGEEIARCNLKSKDYKASCKRGYKIIKPEKPKTQKRKNLKRSELLNPNMKTLRPLTFEKQPKLLNVNHV